MFHYNYLECSECPDRDPETEIAAEIYTPGTAAKKQPGLKVRTLSLVLTRDHSFLSTLVRRRARREKVTLAFKSSAERLLRRRRSHSQCV